MLFFEELKTFIPQEEAKTFFSFDVHLNSTSKPKVTKYTVNKDEKSVTIFLKNLSPKETAQLKRTIKKAFKDDLAILIEESKNPLIERLYNYNDKNDEKTLSFFKDILSYPDYLALRDSLFLRSEFKLHHSINQLKQDIIKRYGERGNTISNLCTAGYFEETMIPLYNVNPAEFHRYWDIAVDRGITALFVNGRMNITKIKSEIKHRIQSGKAYGLKSIHIHGIGKLNIQNIRDCIENEKDHLGFIDKNIFINEGLQVMILEIIL